MSLYWGFIPVLRNPPVLRHMLHIFKMEPIPHFPCRYSHTQFYTPLSNPTFLIRRPSLPASHCPIRASAVVAKASSKTYSASAPTRQGTPFSALHQGMLDATHVHDNFATSLGSSALVLGTAEDVCGYVRVGL